MFVLDQRKDFQMNYQSAKKIFKFRLVLGVFILILSFVSTVISVFKMIYFRLDDGSNIGHAISLLFKNIVYAIYEKTEFLNFFWEHSPVPNQIDIMDKQNLFFLSIYIIFFIGWIVIKSALELRGRIKMIDREIEEDLLRGSARGSVNETRKQIKHNTELPQSSNKFHELYLAPLIVGLILAVVGAALVKAFGLN